MQQEECSSIYQHTPTQTLQQQQLLDSGSSQPCTST
jgi:hypothetical protein